MTPVLSRPMTVTVANCFTGDTNYTNWREMKPNFAGKFGKFAAKPHRRVVWQIPRVSETFPGFGC
jgi:hypothetical protein